MAKLASSSPLRTQVLNGIEALQSRPPTDSVSSESECEEATSEKNSQIFKPYDILCGRHKLAFNNIGNRRFRVTVSLWLDRYIAASSRADKTRVVIQIIDVLYIAGARFFKHDARTDSWVTLSTKEVRAKVGHAIRDMLSAKDMTSPPSVTTSTTSRRSSISSTSTSTETCKEISPKAMSPPSIVSVVSRFESTSLPEATATGAEPDYESLCPAKKYEHEPRGETACAPTTDAVNRKDDSVASIEWEMINDNFDADEYELIQEFLGGGTADDFDMWCDEVIMTTI
jgi:hypothetical protein